MQPPSLLYKPEPLSPAPRGPPGLAPLPPEVSTTLADILLELRELNKTMRLLTGSISRSSEVPPRGAPAGLVTGARPSMESHDAVNTLLALADSDDDIYDSLSLQAICDACAVLGNATYATSNRNSPGTEQARVELWDTGVGHAIYALLARLPSSLPAAQAAQEGLLQTLANLFHSLPPVLSTMRALRPGPVLLREALEPAAMTPFALIKLARVLAGLEWHLERQPDPGALAALQASLTAADGGRWLASLRDALMTVAASDPRAATAARKLLAHSMFYWAG